MLDTLIQCAKITTSSGNVAGYPKEENRMTIKMIKVEDLKAGDIFARLQPGSECMTVTKSYEDKVNSFEWCLETVDTSGNKHTLTTHRNKRVSHIFNS